MKILYDTMLDVDRRGERSARYLAFICALIVYAILSAMLLLEVVNVYEKYLNTQTPQSPINQITPQAPAKKAAPVIYQSPKKSQTPPQTPAAIPEQKTPAQPRQSQHIPQAPSEPSQPAPTPDLPAQAAEQLPPASATPLTERLAESTITPQKPTQKKKQKKTIERSIKLPTPAPVVESSEQTEPAEAPQQTQALEPKKSELVPEQAEGTNPEELEMENPTAARRRSKGKWYRDGVAAPAQVQPAASPTRAERTGYYSRTIPEYEGDVSRHPRYTNDGKQTGTFFKNIAIPEDEAKATEYALFLYKFYAAFCRESRMDPMMVRGALIQPHYITFEITCTKDRKMHNLHFLQPSYDGTLNAYITKIAQAMTPPLLPSVLPQDEAAILVCVKVERIYQQSSIYFVQRFD